MKKVKDTGALGRRIYQYLDQETGQEVLMELGATEEPHDIGEVVSWNGRKLERLPSGDRGRQHEVCVKYDGLFRNYQVNRRDPITRFADGRDKRGTPLFHNRSRARDFGERMKDVGVDVEFDG